MNKFFSFDIISKNKIIFALALLLFVLTLTLRFYKLDTIPPALYQDETAIGYNAYLIAQTGRDEHNVVYPLYFTSFGDHKLPSYIYATALSIKVFGMNAFAVRLPSALFGSMSVFLLFALVYLLSKNKALSFLSAFLLCINPWHLHFSRAGFEVNMGLAFVLLGAVLFLYALKNQKVLFFYFSLVSFVISLYSYNATRILAPLFLVSLIYLNYKNLLRYKKTHIIGMGILLFMLLLPFFMTFFSASGVYSAKNALITSSDILAKNLEMRSYLASLPTPLVSLLYNKYIFQLWQYLQNIASFISVSFFYISGTLHGNQGIGNYGMFHFFELPFFVAGLILFFKKKIQCLKFFILWLGICIATAALSKEVPHATRGYFLVIPGIVFTALGMYHTYLYVQTTKMIIRMCAFTVILFISLYSLQFYFLSYYYRFPEVYARAWRTADRDISFFLKENADKYDKIVIDSETDLQYTSILFYTKFSPSEFLKTIQRDPADSEGFFQVKSFGKYEYRTIDWGKEYPSPKTLFITSYDKRPQNLPIKKTFYLPTRYIVSVDKEQILQYPVREAEFVIIE